jgi:glucokinase
MSCVLAADLGGTNLRMAAVDSAGRILYRTKRATPRGEGREEVVGSIVEAADECRANCLSENVAAVCAALPGTVDAEKGFIFTAPNLPALNNFAAAAALEKALGVKTILENDANAAAVGEGWLGASKDVQTSVCLTLGTGVGGGILIDRKLLHGSGCTAGELGHICVEANGVECLCGARGCIEQYASATAIARLAKELGATGCETSHQVFLAAKSGDTGALEAFRLAGFYLGVAINSLVNIINPEIIVIGGGASEGWELFAPAMHETVRVRAYGGPSERTKIVPAALGDDAGIIGAARLALDSI